MNNAYGFDPFKKTTLSPLPKGRRDVVDIGTGRIESKDPTVDAPSAPSGLADKMNFYWNTFVNNFNNGTQDIVRRMKYPTGSPAQQALENQSLEDQKALVMGLVGGAESTSDTLTSDAIQSLKGMKGVSQQTLLDLSKRPMKAPDQRMLREVAESLPPGSKAPVTEIEQQLRNKLTPLDVTTSDRWDSIVLPDEVRGDVDTYGERIYNSPHPVEAGNVHYGQSKAPNYFGHTRYEDMGNYTDTVDPVFQKMPNGDYDMVKEQQKLGGTRRLLEIQSDLFQRDRYAKESPKLQYESRIKQDEVDIADMERELASERRFAQDKSSSYWQDSEMKVKKIEERIALKKNNITIQKQALADLHPPDEKQKMLEDYGKDERWMNRMIREDVRAAALAGKERVQIPTGDTVARIEGYVGEAAPVSNDATIGDTFDYGGQPMRIIGENSDDTVQAVPEDAVQNEFTFSDAMDDEVNNYISEFEYRPSDYQEDVENIFNKSFDSDQEYNDFIKSKEFDIDRLARTVMEDRYPNADVFANEWSSNIGEQYIHTGDDNIIVVNNDEYIESFSRGRQDTDNIYDQLGDDQRAVHDFYEKRIPKFLKKEYPNMKQVTDDNGLTWWEIPIEEQHKGPVKAFQWFPFVAGAGAAVAASQPQDSDSY